MLELKRRYKKRVNTIHVIKNVLFNGKNKQTQFFFSGGTRPNILFDFTNGINLE